MSLQPDPLEKKDSNTSRIIGRISGIGDEKLVAERAKVKL